MRLRLDGEGEEEEVPGACTTERGRAHTDTDPQRVWWTREDSTASPLDIVPGTRHGDSEGGTVVPRRPGTAAALLRYFPVRTVEYPVAMIQPCTSHFTSDAYHASFHITRPGKHVGEPSRVPFRAYQPTP